MFIITAAAALFFGVTLTLYLADLHDYKRRQGRQTKRRGAGK